MNASWPPGCTPRQFIMKSRWQALLMADCWAAVAAAGAAAGAAVAAAGLPMAPTAERQAVESCALLRLRHARASAPPG